MATRRQRNSNQAQEAARKRRTPMPTTQGPVMARQQVDLGVLQRAVANPHLASSDDILALQRAYGNRAVSGLLAGASHPIQAKPVLRVGPVGDQYEQEADRVADQVMTMPSSTSQSPVQRQMEEEEGLLQTTPLADSITSLVQRQAEEEEEELLQTTPLVQRQAEEEEELLQMKSLAQRQPIEEEEEMLQAKPLVQRQADGGFEASDDIARRLASQKGQGSPLPDETRADMESRFGADFSGVHIHADSEASQMNRELRAKAFTHGSDIYFSPGRYDPGDNAGKRLLAHELTHVVQQTGKQVQRQVYEQAEPVQIGVAPTAIQRMTEWERRGIEQHPEDWKQDEIEYTEKGRTADNQLFHDLHLPHASDTDYDIAVHVHGELESAEPGRTNIRWIRDRYSQPAPQWVRTAASKAAAKQPKRDTSEWGRVVSKAQKKRTQQRIKAIRGRQQRGWRRRW